MANKMSITFDGFDEMIEQLEKSSGNVKGAVNEALQETHKMITTNADDAMTPHNKTFKTKRSIVNGNGIEWVGDVASVDVGFKIRNGGLASIFLMYGTPKMKKDQKLYNAFKGTKTKKDIAELQKEIISKYISIAKKG